MRAAGPGPPRDRDGSGRPRNARPRDALGRPLRRDADGEPPTGLDEALPPPLALAAAQDLLDAGRPFDAHEVLEAAWKAAPAAERELWQGLAQIAVGLTHARRGNARGAVALLTRGADRLARYGQARPAGPGPHGIDLAGLRERCERLAGTISASGLAGADLRVRLTGS